MSLGISTSGMVGPNESGIAFVGDKETKAGLWYDNRRARGCNANFFCRLVLFAASMRGGLLPDASGVTIARAFGEAKGTKGDL